MIVKGREGILVVVHIISQIDRGGSVYFMSIALVTTLQGRGVAISFIHN